MKIEISNGEAIDKLSILQIKLIHIQEEQKKSNILKEYNYLNNCCRDILKYDNIIDLYNELMIINQVLWKIEDDIRAKEKEKIFDQEFIELARQVYITNDHRAMIKKQINLFTNSNFIEEKSYKEY